MESVYDFKLEDYEWSREARFESGTAAESGGEPIPEHNGDGSYTVTYTDQDGKVLFVDTVEPGEEVVPPEMPGVWTVDGQEIDFTSVDGDVTVVLEPAPEPVPEPDPVPTPAPDPAPETKTAGSWWLWLLLIPVLALVLWLILGRKKGGKRETK